MAKFCCPLEGNETHKYIYGVLKLSGTAESRNDVQRRYVANKLNSRNNEKERYDSLHRKLVANIRFRRTKSTVNKLSPQFHMKNKTR